MMTRTVAPELAFVALVLAGSLIGPAMLIGGDSDGFAAAATSETTIEDFESCNLDNWTKEADGGSISTTQSTVAEGSCAAKLSTGGASNKPRLRSLGGLNRYPQPGDTLEFDVRPGGGHLHADQVLA